MPFLGFSLCLVSCLSHCLKRSMYFYSTIYFFSHILINPPWVLVLLFHITSLFVFSFIFFERQIWQFSSNFILWIRPNSNFNWPHQDEHLLGKICDLGYSESFPKRPSLVLQACLSAAALFCSSVHLWPTVLKNLYCCMWTNCTIYAPQLLLLDAARPTADRLFLHLVSGLMQLPPVATATGKLVKR